jgi:hypothetical protein
VVATWIAFPLIAESFAAPGRLRNVSNEMRGSACTYLPNRLVRSFRDISLLACLLTLAALTQPPFPDGPEARGGR